MSIAVIFKSLFYPYYPDAHLRRVLLHICAQQHRFFHHFFVYLRSVKHVQTVFVPYGYSYMARVKSFLACGYRYYVAVVNGSAARFIVVYGVFRDISLLLSRYFFFQLVILLYPFLMRHEHGV
jgi:hypothetical protein